MLEKLSKYRKLYNFMLSFWFSWCAVDHLPYQSLFRRVHDLISCRRFVLEFVLDNSGSCPVRDSAFGESRLARWDGCFVLLFWTMNTALTWRSEFPSVLLEHSLAGDARKESEKYRSAYHCDEANIDWSGKALLKWRYKPHDHQRVMSGCSLPWGVNTWVPLQIAAKSLTSSEVNYLKPWRCVWLWCS